MKLEKEKMKYLITGDKHSHFSDVFTYIASVINPTTITIIVLGDAGINYYGIPKDDKLKSSLNKIGTMESSPLKKTTQIYFLQRMEKSITSTVKKRL